ncbi:hypothetical protein HDU80_000267 [Chytriomyces hyalinus]|nr:hypothetical protein HDU80_000267 [Chytriomyces hyalinus]
MSQYCEFSYKNLAGPLNKNEWVATFNGLLSKNKLLHCTNYKYINNGNRAITSANALATANEDTLCAEHAHTPRGIFTLANVVDNSENRLFPGNLEENKHAILLLLSSVIGTFKTIINKNWSCVHTELQKVLSCCSTVSEHHVKALKKQWDNSHEDIKTFMHKFHTVIENIIANPMVPVFAECISFANQKDKIVDALHPAFAQQKGRIKNDTEHNTLDLLTNLLELIEHEINFIPSHHAPSLTNLTVDANTTRRGKQVSTKQHCYNPLQTPRHQPKLEYECLTCKAKGSHWTWQCQKDPRFAEFKRQHDLNPWSTCLLTSHKKSKAPSHKDITHLSNQIRAIDPVQANSFLSVLTKLILPNPTLVTSPPTATTSGSQQLVTYPGFKLTQE